jgi:hypothetical protein
MWFRIFETEELKVAEQGRKLINGNQVLRN